MIFDLSLVKSLRKQLGLTQHQFAKQAGVSQSMIAKIESKRLDPSYSIVKKLEEAVNRLSASNELTAKEIMTKKVLSVSPSSSVKSVIDILQKNQVSQLPVIEEGKVVGLISEGSLLEKEGKTAREVMTLAPPLVPESTRKSVLVALLRQYPLILITKGSDIVGVVTKSDLLRIL